MLQQIGAEMQSQTNSCKVFWKQKHSYFITGLLFVSQKWVCLSFIVHLISRLSQLTHGHLLQHSATGPLLIMTHNDGLNAHHFPLQHVNDQLQRPRGKETEAHKTWTISDEALVSKSVQKWRQSLWKKPNQPGEDLGLCREFGWLKTSQAKH